MTANDSMERRFVSAQLREVLTTMLRSESQAESMDAARRGVPLVTAIADGDEQLAADTMSNWLDQIDAGNKVEQMMCGALLQGVVDIVGIDPDKRCFIYSGTDTEVGQ